MKKIILFALILLWFSPHSYAQKTDLRKMGSVQRNEYLVKLAKEVVMNFGPDYYREDLIPNVSKEPKELRVGYSRAQKYVGKKYYTVTFRDREGYPWSSVDIWEKTGEPMGITFDGGSGYNFLFRSYRDWIKDGVKEEEKWKRENDSQHHH